MGNCCKTTQKREIVLLLVGLDNAGKTVTIKGLAGENPEDSLPTVGFSVINMKYMNSNVTIYDLGGRSDIRGIWPQYFMDAHGVIFVIDSTDYDRIDEAKIVLHELLSNEKISGKPVLLLANKQDSEFALDEIDLAEKLDLERLVNEQKCPTLLETCAYTNKKHIDKGIKTGYKWLINYILRDYIYLNERVSCDVEKQKILMEQKRKCLVRVNTFDENQVQVNGDPFKPINKLLNSAKSEKLQRNNSTSSTKSYLINKKRVVKQRPKSAIEIVKRQLEIQNRRSSIFVISSNKVSPAKIFTPKRLEKKNELEISPTNLNSQRSNVTSKNDNLNSPMNDNLSNVTNSTNSPQIITVLPYSTDVVVETHELFTINHVRPQSNNNVPLKLNGVKKTVKRTNIQEDLDIIMKDIS